VFPLLLLLLGLISSSHSKLLKCFVKQATDTYLCGDPYGVLVTRVIKKKHSTGLSDRLRDGKGWNRPCLCGLLNGD
jgi:AAA+ ATPase superfamily predicted ATPase